MAIHLERISNMEFKVGENIIRIIEDSILYIEVIGEQTDEYADAIKKNYEYIFSLFPGKIKQLINLNKSGKSSKASRDVFKKLNEHERTEKVAVYGIHPVARVLAAFVTGLTSKNIMFFTNEKDALTWLKKE